MPPSLSDLLVTDDTTILLGLIAATVFLLNNLYKPQPLVHPILLGRQSDVARVRNPGESSVYRNYGTGLMGRFPLRPAKDVHILADMLKPDSDAPRTLWSTKISNPQLQDRVAAFGTGLLRLAGLEVGESSVLLLLNDCVEFIIADLALASHSIPSFTIAAANLMSPVLESHTPSAIITHASMLPQILEFIYDAGEANRNHTIIVVGEPSSQAMATVASKVRVLKWSDVEREGVRVEKIISPLPKPNDVFTVSFFSESGHIQGAQLTHENLTAGVAAVRALLPLSHAFSQLDTIVSAHYMGTAYGRAIAYTALFEGTSFATLESSKLFHADDYTPQINVADALSSKVYPIPSPTIAFIKPGHLHTLVDAILKEARKRLLLFPFAWRHKLAGISEGFMTKESLWDRLVFDTARSRAAGDGSGALRAVVVSGGPLPAKALTPSRVALSVPIINCFSHPLVAGPVLASHALDLQDLSTENVLETAHTGPPSINVEGKLVGVEDEAVEGGADPAGVLTVRGPSVGKLTSMESSYVSIPSGEDEGWVGMGVRATILTNGAFLLS